jgi:hypothetical protein
MAIFPTLALANAPTSDGSLSFKFKPLLPQLTPCMLLPLLCPCPLLKQRLITELRHLWCVSKLSFMICIDGLLDEWIYLAPHEPSTLQQSLQMLPTLQHLNSPSNAKQFRLSTPNRSTRMAPLLRQWVLTHRRPR